MPCSHDIQKANNANKNVWAPYQESLKKDEGKPYQTKEEQRNIENVEQYTAHKLGRLKEGEGTRTTHSGEVIVKTVIPKN